MLVTFKIYLITEHSYWKPICVYYAKLYNSAERFGF